MIKVKLSQKITAIRSRIQRLPKVLDDVMSFSSKKRAKRFITIFQEGILNNTFRLIKLQPNTIRAKEAKGYPKPTYPLYGLGDEGDKTLVNVFAIRKLKNGWKVYPRKAKHHEADLNLEQLLQIHEYGAIIKSGKRLIRIPPRPAMRLAMERLLREISKEDDAKLVKKACTDLINKNRVSRMKSESDKVSA